MTRTCRILPHLRGVGPANMALDEALLDYVAADPSMAVARTYEWSIPTLSLGYFQSIAEAESDPRWSDVPIVRRPTGGGTLWHDIEVTYAVVVPADHPSARPSRQLYRAIHQAIADHLNHEGIAAIPRGPAGTANSAANRPFLCFTDRDEEDIVLRNVKIVGSAQRRRSGAVLQHGSLLLGRSSKTPELPGLSDLASVSASPLAWGSILQSLLPRALGLEPLMEEIPVEVLQRTEALITDRYGNPAWTRRR